MSVREAMARLNPATTKFDIGRGGMPSLTPQDIAAAAGMCANKIEDKAIARLAQGVFWWLYGPEFSVRPSNDDDARRAVLDEVLREFNARYQAAAIARLAVHNLEFDAPASRRGQADHQREVERAKSAMRQVHSSCWPARDMSVYRRIVDVVALEFRSPRQCPECDGRKHCMIENVLTVCGRCNGVGRVGLHNTWRAEQLGIAVERFKKTWRPVYEWVYNYVDGLQCTACLAVEKVLYDES